MAQRVHRTGLALHGLHEDQSTRSTRPRVNPHLRKLSGLQLTVQQFSPISSSTGKRNQRQVQVVWGFQRSADLCITAVGFSPKVVLTYLIKFPELCPYTPRYNGYYTHIHFFISCLYIYIYIFVICVYYICTWTFYKSNCTQYKWTCL